eukprot:XP_001689644.1 predicted protein [Chlamydomonas reinhardtii]
MTYCNKSFKEAPGLQDERYLNLSADAKDLLLKMLADDPKARPTCLEVLKHPFMTADESTAAAHREMGDLVRNRMRDLAQLRRVHGLQYALRLAKKEGVDKQAFLSALEQRRLKLSEANTPNYRDVENGGPNAGRSHPNSAGPGSTPLGRTSMGPGAGASHLARYSLAQSYAAANPGPGPHHARGGASGAGSRADDVMAISVDNPLSSASSSAQEPALPTSRPPVPPIPRGTVQLPVTGTHMAQLADIGPAGVLSPRDSAFGHASLPPLPGTLASRSGASAGGGLSTGFANGPDLGKTSTPDRSSYDIGQAAVPTDLKVPHARQGLPPRPPEHSHFPAFSHASAPPGAAATVSAVPEHMHEGSKGSGSHHTPGHHRRGLSNATADSSQGPAAGQSHHATVDPYAIVNAALPSTLQHCNSMPVADAVLGVGMGLGLNDDGGRVGGGSPVATMEVLEQAHMISCCWQHPNQVHEREPCHVGDDAARGYHGPRAGRGYGGKHAARIGHRAGAEATPVRGEVCTGSACTDS